MLEKEYKYFKDNIQDLLKEHKGKFLVIKDISVLGAFDTYNDAMTFALSKYELGQFLIQECVEEKLTTAQFFNSFVVVNEKSI